MTQIRITHIGGPTALLEIGGWRILTDPTFDPPGRRYAFGWGTSSRKTTGPAVSLSDLPPVDAVLLSHDHHGDNLDVAGRTMLPGAGTVITTVAAVRRLGHGEGLRPWATTELRATGRPTVTVTATPARHGPPLSRPIAGAVIGFVLQWPGQERGALWISGDTVLFRGVREVARRFDIGTALLHLGAVRFPVTGPLYYSMTARQALRVCRRIRPATAIPVHYEGWQHFSQGRETVERHFAGEHGDLGERLHWLTPGTPAELTV
ncbi:MBL fold metallo-hydrolase [Actinoplanes utahensis]|uniref:Beta-lactamase n=1 Tax=Actinoplanes utahensis TaxID=1869 RepID=A0A0A6UM71_ACTUT|nr:MBL fold metallo-hydrolase [Actinoplanes utahensis]KHD77235.1 beta-lactamase [Actinoplanes utahensis]GIF33530.1 MBL fold metallo-hydrolase [Actinoplanes utahensis]